MFGVRFLVLFQVACKELSEHFAHDCWLVKVKSVACVFDLDDAVHGQFWECSFVAGEFSLYLTLVGVCAIKEESRPLVMANVFKAEDVFLIVMNSR